ncbi:DNA-3-methyladenine glycosylase family protein [uncultured Amnibacterium sp.]|uniref:DNA-3-methyladenine glycosylase family protein n=1 Tax=uncultured Amnibacterium sp. TaxID=1631851 RepID=UPI0035C95F4E
MRGTADPTTPVSAAERTPAARTVYAPGDPVDLLSTVRVLRRGASDPTYRREPDRPVVWRTCRTPSGPATLRLAQHADGSVHAYAWGAGADWAVEGVPELLGEGDDWSGLAVARVPLLADTLRRRPGLRLTRCRQVFEMLVAAVLEQKIATVDAHRAWAWLLRRHGEAAPGPAPQGMRVAPDVDGWRRIPSWDWHRAGVEPKASTAVMAAAGVAPGLERTLALGRGGAEVAQRLRSVPGIGIWTAAETSQRSHGDPDAPSFGDLHLPGIVGTALIGRKVDDDGMLELLEPWRGSRQRVMRLIVASGVAVPRRAQRLAPQDHRHH